MKEEDKITIESLLREKLKVLFETMNERNGNLFDENTDIIEMLISRDVKGYNELTEYQTKLKQALLKKMSQVERDSHKRRNAISRENFKNEKKSEYEWKYRKDYLFKIIDVLVSRSILESERPPVVGIEKV